MKYRKTGIVNGFMLVAGGILLVLAFIVSQGTEAEAACNTTPSCTYDVTAYGCKFDFTCNDGSFGCTDYLPCCYYEDGCCVDTHTRAYLRQCYLDDCIVFL